MRFAIAPIFAPSALPIIDYILVDPFNRTRDGKGTFDIASFGVNPDFHAATLFVEYFEGPYVCMWMVLVPLAINELKGGRQ